MKIPAPASKLLALTVLAFSQAVFAADSTVTPASDSLKLPAIFADNMVLQQQQPVPVWGWSAPGAKVTVKFAGQSKSTHADRQGVWRVKLGKLTASFTPQSLVIESGGTKVFTNILVGEVWLCSGQSNMEKPIDGRPWWKPCFNSTQELAAANFPAIRLFKVEQTLAHEPLSDFKKIDAWRLCDSNALQTISFSAAAYFFGREIQTNLNVPVGLIESSWGGTRIEPWTPKAGFDSVPSLVKLGIPVAKSTAVHPTTPMAIYNAMIAPMVGFAIRGALWYQGESNLSGAANETDYLTYAEKMAALIGGWRKIWDEGNFPFYFVQIAPYRYNGRDKATSSPERLPEFWTIQSRAARTIKNTGMVVTTDLVDDLDDIHPRDKENVGHRLALLARNKTYGEKDVVASGPVFKQMKIEGNKATLTFDNADGGLISRDGQPLTWFGIAGQDGKFVDADIKIVGDTLELSSTDVEKPEAVRFAWREVAQPNFCNKAGLPAEPFTTEKPAAK
ncbi:MAG TPA: sialate O-acetylesterase [Verrucomicrobiae bacterium]|jgi:sialate O-acetylesterase|nr:sialate O-acetylesterase [Verrucomicrobiae bacterium]